MSLLDLFRRTKKASADAPSSAPQYTRIVKTDPSRDMPIMIVVAPGTQMSHGEELVKSLAARRINSRIVLRETFEEAILSKLFPPAGTELLNPQLIFVCNPGEPKHQDGAQDWVRAFQENWQKQQLQWSDVAPLRSTPLQTRVVST